MGSQTTNTQLRLPFQPVRQWGGGARTGAGRPRATGRRNVEHRRREAHKSPWPVLVTLRARRRSLRRQLVFPALRGAIVDTSSARPREFRACEFSVQDDHVHLLVEAQDESSLTRGITGLCVRIAKRLNRLFSLRGRFFADRHHRAALKTPARCETRSSTCSQTYASIGRSRFVLDVYSSAPYFRAFQECCGQSPLELGIARIPRALNPPELSPCAPARTWLLSLGWRRCRLRISMNDGPVRPPQKSDCSAASNFRPLQGKERSTNHSDAESRHSA